MDDNNPGIGNNTFSIKFDKDWCSGGILQQIQDNQPREYSALTKERIEEFLKDLVYKGPKIELFYYDNDLDAVRPYTESPEFDKAMKRLYKEEFKDNIEDI